MKTCRACGLSKPLGDFHRRSDSSDGHQHRCKACAAESVQRSRRANPEAWAKAQQRAKAAERAVHATPEGRERKRAVERRRYHANREQRRAQMRARYRRNAATRIARATARKAARRMRGFRGVLLGDPCAYCGGPADTLDHIVATVAGGQDTEDNLTGACRRCNSAKKDRPLLAFLAAGGMGYRSRWYGAG